jgi:hypothetical protein
MSLNEERLVSVYTTTNPAMISIVKSLLDNAEIEYMVRGDSLQSVWATNLLAYVDFQVKPEDEAEAREVLKDVIEGDNSPQT